MSRRLNNTNNANANDDDNNNNNNAANAEDNNNNNGGEEGGNDDDEEDADQIGANATEAARSLIHSMSRFRVVRILNFEFWFFFS